MCIFPKICLPILRLKAPLLKLRQKNRQWFWDEKLQATFETVKPQFVETVFLHHLNSDVPFIVQPDRSGIALAGILNEEIDNQPYLISTRSRTLSPCERRNITTEQELLTITTYI